MPPTPRTRLRLATATTALAVLALVLAACGGDAGPVITDGPTPTAAEAVPYDPASLLKRRIPSGAPDDPRSDAIIARFTENARESRVGVATHIEVPPIHTVRATDPFFTVRVDDREVRFRVPADAEPGGGADHPLVLQDPRHPDLGRDVELRLYQAEIDRDAREIRAEGAGLGHYNNDGRRLNPDGSRSVGVPFLGGGTGSGLSILAGLVRPDEVRAGRIRHAVRFAYSAVDSSDRFRAPAVKTDQPRNGVTRDPDQAMDMGMRLQLDPEVDCARRTVPGRSDRSRETRFLRILCRALQEYGMVMLDGTADGGILLEMEGDETAGWADVIGETRSETYGYIVRDRNTPADGLDRDDRSGIPWDRMRVVAAP